MAFSFALMTLFVSNNLHPRFEHRAETIAQQFAILQGKPYLLDGVPTYFPEFQNRILFPIFLSLATALHVGSDSEVYLVLRTLTAFAAFIVFWWLLQTRSVSLRVASVGMGALAFVLVFTFNHGWEHPTDFLDVIFVALFVWACVSKHRLLAMGLAIVASANRESSPFIGVIWFVLYAVDEQWRFNWKEGVFAIGLSVLAYVTVLTIGFAFGGVAALAPQTTAVIWLGKFLLEALANPSPSAWPLLLVAMVLPLALWIGANWRPASFQTRRVLLAGIAIALIAPLFGIIKELRFFIPAATVLIYGACLAETDRQTAFLKTESSMSIPKP